MMKIEVVKKSGVKIKPFGLLDFGAVIEVTNEVGKMLVSRAEFKEVATPKTPVVKAPAQDDKLKKGSEG